MDDVLEVQRLTKRCESGRTWLKATGCPQNQSLEQSAVPSVVAMVGVVRLPCVAGLTAMASAPPQRM